MTAFTESLWVIHHLSIDGTVALEEYAVGVKRIAREVEPDELTLLIEALHIGELDEVCRRRRAGDLQGFVIASE